MADIVSTDVIRPQAVPEIVTDPTEFDRGQIAQRMGAFVTTLKALDTGKYEPIDAIPSDSGPAEVLEWRIDDVTTLRRNFDVVDPYGSPVPPNTAEVQMETQGPKSDVDGIGKVHFYNEPLRSQWLSEEGGHPPSFPADIDYYLTIDYKDDSLLDHKEAGDGTVSSAASADSSKPLSVEYLFDKRGAVGKAVTVPTAQRNGRWVWWPNEERDTVVVVDEFTPDDTRLVNKALDLLSAKVTRR